MLKITETIRATALVTGLLLFSIAVFSQTKDSTTHVLNFDWNISLAYAFGKRYTR